MLILMTWGKVPKDQKLLHLLLLSFLLTIYMDSNTGGHELSKTTGNAGARIGCGNVFLKTINS